MTYNVWYNIAAEKTGNCLFCAAYLDNRICGFLYFPEYTPFLFGNRKEMVR